MSSKHTPGEWRAESDGLIVSVNDEYVIARIEKYSDQAPRDQREANARLIADAPALLDALRELHDFSVVDVRWRNKEQSEKAFQTAIDLLTKHGA